MIWTVPRNYFIVAGTGEGYTPLNAFDAALGAAGVGDLNLVKVSSIVPPRCARLEPRPIDPGMLIAAAFAEITSTMHGEVIAAGIAIGLPEDESRAGVIMEYSALGHKEEIEEIVCTMARKALESRGLKIRSIESRSVEIKVKNDPVAAFAGVVLI
jgi:arginine decarboxylase